MANSGQSKGWFRRKKGSLVYTWLTADRKERSKVIGPDTMTDNAGWVAVGKLGLDKLAQQPDQLQCTFAHISQRYLDYNKRLNGKSKAESTQRLHKHIIGHYLNPRFGHEIAIDIKPSVIQDWLDSLDMHDATKYKLRVLMGTVYKYAQKYDLIPRRDDTNPIKWVSGSDSSDWEARVLTPEQTLQVLNLLGQPERELTLLVAATGLRQSEALALKWRDLDEEAGVIRIASAYVHGTLQDRTKSKASKGTVPYHKLLATVLNSWKQESMYAGDDDYVFASVKSSGKVPRSGSVLVCDHLRPAAVKAGVIEATEKRFGFHNLRHSLATTLARSGSDAKMIQTLLRHSKVDMSFHYVHSMADDRIQAQGQILGRLLQREPQRVQ